MSELKIKSGNRALQKSLPAFIFNRFFVGSPGGGAIPASGLGIVQGDSQLKRC